LGLPRDSRQFIKETVMKASIATIVFSTALAAAIPAQGAEQLGKVNFPTSCDPAVQQQFERGVAMLHSFWFSAGEKTFRDVLVQDPSCAIANWGIAAILMSNPLAGAGASPKGAAVAQAAIDQGRIVSPKTQRERDYIEAVAAYYEDWSNRPERARQQRAPRRLKHWPPATRMTTRRGFSVRYTSPARIRRRIKPLRRT